MTIHEMTPVQLREYQQQQEELVCKAFERHESARNRGDHHCAATWAAIGSRAVHASQSAYTEWKARIAASIRVHEALSATVLEVGRG